MKGTKYIYIYVYVYTDRRRDDILRFNLHVKSVRDIKELRDAIGALRLRDEPADRDDDDDDDALIGAFCEKKT